MDTSKSLIGLGQMGAAIGAALTQGGEPLVVWNRTTAKARPLIEAGATLADSVAESIRGSDVVLICVGNYAQTSELLAGTEALWAGKLLIQLSGGTPREARALEAWTQAAGADYLDGCMITFPEKVGSRDAAVYACGSPRAWARGEQILRQLGYCAYLGEDLAAHLTFEYAFVLPMHAGTVAAVQMAHLCERVGIPVTDLIPVLTSRAFTQSMASSIRRQLEGIANETFEDPQATLKTCTDGLSKRIGHFENTGVNIDFMKALEGLLRKGVDAGYGEEGLGSLVKVLRQTARPANG